MVAQIARYCRIGAVVVLIVASVLVLVLDMAPQDVDTENTDTKSAEAVVKGLLLALLGGGILLVTLVPLERPNLQSISVFIGTGMITTGSWYLLSDAVQQAHVLLALLIITAVILIATVMLLPFLLWLVGRREPDYIEKNRNTIVRNMKRQLKEVVDDVRHTGPRGPDGVLYQQFDHVISMLFQDTWSMINEPRLWTYAPAKHRDLIGNYIVARLEKTAAIAISKHPHQCKYGAIAYNLADYGGRWLRITQLITEFDPLPPTCPECKEPKPTHKANCMAAICWQCKYPTPPRNPDSQNTKVVTPQCYHGAPCFPRGELVTPVDPIVPRIGLPFTIPQNGEDQSPMTGHWPGNRRGLHNLLERLHHE